MSKSNIIPFEQRKASKTINYSFRKRAKESNCDFCRPCLHEFVILLGESNGEPIYRCMFCNESIDDPQTLENCIVIDVSNYGKGSYCLENSDDIDKKLYMTRSQVMKILQCYPNSTNEQFGIMMNQNYGGRSYQKKKIG